MTTEAAEQGKGTEEPTKETGADLIRKGLGEDVSKETETVSEEEEVKEEETETSEEGEGEEGEVEEEDKKVVFDNQEALDKYIEDKVQPLAQGMKDKELKPVYDEAQGLKKENADLKARLDDKEEDTKLGRLEKAELEEYGDTPEVRDYQEVKRETIRIARETRAKAKDIEGTASRLDTVAKEQKALQAAIKLFLPEDNDFISDIEAFAEKLAGVETQREMDLLTELEEAKIKGQAKPKTTTKRKKPDSNIPTAPGGADLSGLTPRELIARGLKEGK